MVRMLVQHASSAVQSVMLQSAEESKLVRLNCIEAGALIYTPSRYIDRQTDSQIDS